MQYFTRQLFMPPVVDDEGYDNDGVLVLDNKQAEDLDIASKAYLERQEEIWDQLSKPVRDLIKDDDWALSELRFVDDHFYIIPAEELNFFIQAGDHMFILRYTVEQIPHIDAPSEEDKVHFQTEKLALLEEEWDIENGELIHRILLTNGFIVTFRPKKFRWWKVKVEAEA